MTVERAVRSRGDQRNMARSSNAAPSGRLPMVSEATGLPAAESTTATPLAQADSVSFGRRVVEDSGRAVAAG